MEKYIKWIIDGLFLISCLIILSIGIEVLPLFNCNILSIEKCTQINAVCLNLAYSYFAGFIMFKLTVSFPQFLRKREYKPLIENLITEYNSKIELEFFMFCFQNESIDLIDKDREFIASFRKALDVRHGEEQMEKIFLDTDKIDRYRNILRLLETHKEFIKNILPNENFINPEQLRLINQLKRNDISNAVETYSDFMGIKEIDNNIYKEISKFREQVNQLYRTI